MRPIDIRHKRVLISPLDWGMGHTTRCVVLIKQLISSGNVVFFAGNTDQIDFMKREFPQIEFLFLAGYNVQFDSGKSSYLQIINQLFKIKSAINNENDTVKKLVDQFKIDIIISDNRYGLFASATKNILITHQLSLQIPYLKNWVNSQLQKWINKFDFCWIPDDEKNPLCGELINASLKIPKLYIGLLNRFSHAETPSRYKYIGIISGPEPERSIFAIKLEKFLISKHEPALMIGYEGNNPKITYCKNPTTGELGQLILESETVISKAGYTTIMEMTDLKKNAILISTRGQFEQEYLAKNIQSENIQFVSESDIF
ncbi:MAG: hypothetical protein JNJ99_11120 [Crocinitomicaceae bacterium]|nr:hypothetical protein [Crocinitomicaceae bacterium]